jgi:hypothetical protein
MKLIDDNRNKIRMGSDNDSAENVSLKSNSETLDNTEMTKR